MKRCLTLVTGVCIEAMTQIPEERITLITDWTKCFFKGKRKKRLSVRKNLKEFDISALFLLSALPVALPAETIMLARYDSAGVSVMVTFQVRHRFPCHGTCAKLSGRFPSD